MVKEMKNVLYVKWFTVWRINQWWFVCNSTWFVRNALKNNQPSRPVLFVFRKYRKIRWEWADNVSEHYNYKRLWNKNMIQNTKDIWLFAIMTFKSCDISLKSKMAKLKLKINDLLLKLKLELGQILYCLFKLSKN